MLLNKIKNAIKLKEKSKPVYFHFVLPNYFTLNKLSFELVNFLNNFDF